MVAKVRIRLTVSKQAAQKFDGEKLNLRQLNGLQVRKQYQIGITNRFAVLGKLNDDKDINRAWKNIKENIKTSAKGRLSLHELKQHKPWFDEECSHFLDQRKKTKKQWVQDTSQSNVDNLNTVRHEAHRHFRNKKTAYLQAKFEELEIIISSKMLGTCIRHQ